MIKTIIHFIVLLGSIIGTILSSNDVWTGAFIGGAFTSTLFLVESIIEHRKYLSLLFQCKLIYRNKLIRFSISYLYKIKVDDKYLLVKGKRIDQYQPVGGVYKRYPESREYLRDLQALDDNSMPIDQHSINDLRIRVPGKNAVALIKWFDMAKSREVSPFREFCEELLVPQILNRNKFYYVDYTIIGRIEKGVRFSQHFQCYEYLIADIIELRPNNDQLLELKNLMNQNSNEYVWATENTIRRKGYNPDVGVQITISETAAWTI